MARTQIGGSGTSTDAMGVGGHPGSGVTNDAENWDGSSWTEISNVNTSRQGGMCIGNSTPLHLFVGGNNSPTYYTITEAWNGTSWTEVADLSTASYNGTSVGGYTNGLVAGGIASAPTQPAATEEWTIPESISNLTITD